MKSFLAGIYQMFVEPIFSAWIICMSIVIIGSIIAALFVAFMKWVGISI